MNSEKYKRGTEIINLLNKEGDKKLIEGLKDIAPDLSNYVLEFI